MTRILFLPDDRTILQFDSAEPAEDLVGAVNAGKWLPPEPYRGGFGLGLPENRPAFDVNAACKLNCSVYRPLLMNQHEKEAT